MSDDYRARFPDLFRLWVEHDLVDHGPGIGSYRPEFYGGLRPGDEPVVWRFIEENYLLKYRDFVRIGFDWMADGLWGIPFPESVTLGPSISPKYFGMPGWLAARIQSWQANLDGRGIDAHPDEEDFDYEASDVEGLEIAREVKAFLGGAYYVEFHPFGEISIRDGKPVKLEVPPFIAHLVP